MGSVTRDALALYLSDSLQSARVADYCPNGLQVEGRPVIRRLVTGVTASQALIDSAIACNADAILVHHGLFWKGDPSTLSGFRKTRLKAVLGHELNVFAYHLPLDVHPEWGNNVQLGVQMGWPLDRTVGDKGLVCMGQLERPVALSALTAQLHTTLGRPVDVIGEPQRTVQTVAWCTGGAASYVEMAAQNGADVFVTGELSEPAVHVAQESGITLLGAGHHATERGGVQALGAHLQQRFGIEVLFIDHFVTV